MTRRLLAVLAAVLVTYGTIYHQLTQHGDDDLEVDW